MALFGLQIHHGHWAQLPHVRSDGDLTLGERAADQLKRAFGSWPFLLGMIGIIVVWIVCNKTRILVWDTSDLLLLNLTLSIIAGLQGGALQIASNRGDRISSELAKHTYENGKKLLEINQTQLEILQALRALQGGQNGNTPTASED